MNGLSASWCASKLSTRRRRYPLLVYQLALRSSPQTSLFKLSVQVATTAAASAAVGVRHSELAVRTVPAWHFYNIVTLDSAAVLQHCSIRVLQVQLYCSVALTELQDSTVPLQHYSGGICGEVGRETVFICSDVDLIPTSYALESLLLRSLGPDTELPVLDVVCVVRNPYIHVTKLS